MIDLEAQSASVRLQILLAKTTLSDVEKTRANALLRQITDWDDLTASSNRNFSLPLVRRNLLSLDRELLPDDIWVSIENQSNQLAVRNIILTAEQKRFKETCIDALGLDAIFFKGVTMASQYYPDIGLRPCRDVDVLVKPGEMEVVARKAMANGFKLVTSDGTGTEMTTPRDIRAALRYDTSLTLLLPEKGFVVDLQDRLDKNSGIFESYDFFENAQSVEYFGTTLKTLPPDFLFNYLCHHHTRHTWSNLHWLSDLDALISSDQFDRGRALGLAETLGQKGTAEASLELHALMSTVTEWDNGQDQYRGKEFLSLAIQNLAGKLSLEKAISLGMIGGEFMYEWQADPALVQRARKQYWRKIFRPTLSQYARRPLPEALQAWYYVPRFFELIGNRVERGSKPKT